MPKIYLSYRQNDRVPGALVNRIAACCVNCGFDEILTRWNTSTEMAAAIRSADAVLVLIGEQWQSLLDQHRGDSSDPVQQEIGLSLEARKPVVPLLLGGKVPAVDALPERLRALYLCLGSPIEPEALEEQLPLVLRPLLTVAVERREAEASAKEEERRLAQAEARQQEDHHRAQEILERAKYFSPGPIFAPGTLPFRAQPAKAQPAATVPPSAAAVPPPAAAPAASPNPPPAPPIAATAPVPAIPGTAPAVIPAPAAAKAPAPPKPVLPPPTPAPAPLVSPAPAKPATPAPQNKKGRGCLGWGLVLLLLLAIAAGLFAYFGGSFRFAP